MAKLATYVHVTDDKGVAHAFGPADEVPEWAASKITNPKAWEVPPSANRLAEPAADSPAPARKAPVRRKAAPRGATD